MKNNNGKIAIAIVAMFVVALSVVGFTYAYFTAQVEGNDPDATSVQVTAGSMVVTYSGGSTEKFEPVNLVPGWSNDGDKYYDTVASANVVNGETRITAASLATVTENGTKPENAKPYGESLETAGLMAPVTFSVKNTGDNKAAYDLDMAVTQNLINVDDVEDVTFTVTAVTTDAETATPAYAATTLTDEPLAATGGSHDIETELVLNPGQIRYYKIIFTYDDNGNQNTQQTQLGAFKTQMSITGLSQEVAYPTGQ